MKRFLPITTWLAALFIVAGALLCFEADLLWKLQEQNLFLSGKVFFLEQMVEPGGLLTWTGTWFTQFLYYPWLGVLMLCGWWLLLMWLVKKAFHLSNRWLSVTIVPVLLLLLTIVDMGYWLYILKLRGHVFLATIGTTAAVALLWAFRSLVDRGQRQPTLLRSAFVVMVCAVGYPLLGVYGLGAAALMAVWIWRLEQRRLSALIVSLTGLVSVVFVPLLFYRHVYYQTNIANIYVAKLPLYVVTKEYNSYYVPYILLLLFFLVMTLVKFGQNPEALKPSAQSHVARKAKIVNYQLLIVNCVVFALLVCGVAYGWYKDENFHHELRMLRCFDRMDYEGVLKEAARQNDEPTRAIVMMRNLALAHLGRQGDKMYHYKNGCKRCDAPFDIRAINTVGALVYYHYGMPNYSYRLCMERGVEFGWRAEQLKYMSRCAVINGEPQLARKYLRLLRQTLFHDAWADNLWQYTEHPEDANKMPEMAFISHMMHYDNELTTDHNLVEDFLMKRLMYSNYYKDPVFLEQTMLAAMAAKNSKLFWTHFYNFYQFYPDRPWPYHVQEAVYMFGNMEGRPNMDRCPVSPAVKESFERFTMTTPRYEGLSVEKVKEGLYPLFGNTYYYDYFVVNFPSQN